MISLPVTSLLVGVLVLLMVPLSLLVSLRRKDLKVGYGDGDDRTLRRRMRAFGNFIEYAPMGVLAVAMIELAGASNTFVCIVATGVLLSRILHAIGMLFASTPALQGAGIVIQHATFLTAGGWLVLHYFG